MEASKDEIICILDEADKHLIAGRTIKMRSGYPSVYDKVTQKEVRVHHLVIGKVAGLEVDHINRVRHDNRRINLRHVTHRENLLNRNSWGRSPRGVYFDKTHWREKPWKAIRVINGKKHNLGYYKTEQEASLAFQNYKP